MWNRDEAICTGRNARMILALQLQTAIQALVVGSCRREFWRFSFELWVIWAVCNCSASPNTVHLALAYAHVLADRIAEGR